MRVGPLHAERIRALVPVHLEAFAGFKNARLGLPYAEAFLGWFCTERDGVAICASIEERLVGYVVGAPVGYQSRLNRRLGPVVARCLVTRPKLWVDPQIAAAVWSRARVLWSHGAPTTATAGLPPPVYALVGIGVAGAARGLGVGEALVRAFEGEVRERGARSVRLSVLRENRPACRLYARCGWAVHGPSDTEVLQYAKLV